MKKYPSAEPEVSSYLRIEGIFPCVFKWDFAEVKKENREWECPLVWRLGKTDSRAAS